MEEPTNNLNPFIQVVQDQEDALLQEQEEMIVDAVENQGFTAVTRSGRQVKKPARLIETINTAMSAITSVEKSYYEALQEIASAFMDLNQDLGNEEIVCVGAALGGGFGTTDELRPMKYNEAMATKDKSEWLKAVKEEFERMQDHQVFKLVKQAEVPPGAKVLTSTWAMKKKSNGKFRARLNGRGYEQIDGEHYDKDSIASPTINIVTVRIMMVLMLLMRGYAHLVDVNGAFLLGNWENDPITEEER